MIDSSQLPFKIILKLLDNSVLEFEVTASTKVAQLKFLIKLKTKIPKFQQRLLFSGKLLNDNDSLSLYNINEGQSIHLLILQENQLGHPPRSESPETQIVPASPMIPAMDSPATPFRSQVVQGIFRNLNNSMGNQLQKRQQLVQQRHFGFLVNEKESCEIVRQNLLTISHLFQSRKMPFLSEYPLIEPIVSENEAIQKLNSVNLILPQKNSVELHAQKMKDPSITIISKTKPNYSLKQTETQNSHKELELIRITNSSTKKTNIGIPKIPTETSCFLAQPTDSVDNQDQQPNLNESTEQIQIHATPKTDPNKDKSTTNSKQLAVEESSEALSSPLHVQRFADSSQKNVSEINQRILEELVRNPFHPIGKDLQVGQWVDVMDETGCWKDGEIIGYDKHGWRVHYNGLSRDKDEWLSRCSPRLAPFHSHTVQKEDCLFMSPVPKKKLDGDLSESAVACVHVRDLLYQALGQIETAGQLLNELAEILDSRPPQSKIEILEIENEERYLKQQNTFSNKLNDNFSVKLQINDFLNEKRKDETVSMKSLKFQNNENEILKLKKNKREMSPNSMKSQFSNEHNFLPDHEIEELIEEERSIESNYIQKIIHQDQLTRKTIEKRIRAQQLAPLLDRLGRAMVDLAPHLAMLGSLYSTGHQQNPDFAGLSTATLDGGSIFSNTITGIYDRFLNLQRSSLFPVSTTNISQIFGDGAQFKNRRKNSNANISAENGFTADKFLFFQVPVLLNPGEVSLIENSASYFQNEAFVDLHINAVVRNKHLRNSSFGIQTEEEDEIPIEKF